MTTASEDYEIVYKTDEVSRIATRYSATVTYSSGGSVHVGAYDPAMRDLLLAGVLGHHITFETFFAAIARPIETLKYAAEPMNATYFGGKDGAEEAREISRKEINRAVKTYARTLGMITPGDDEDDISSDDDDVIVTDDETENEQS